MPNQILGRVSVEVKESGGGVGRLRSLADKAYTTLQEEAREQLSITAYFAQLPQPQVSFSVCRKQLAT